MSFLNTNWEAHPEWYDFLHKIDWENKELSDGGGQCIQLICKFDWEIRIEQQTDGYEWGYVRLAYTKSDQAPSYWPHLEPWQLYSPWIRYKITRGGFLIRGPFAYQRQYFGSKVEFESTPFPARRAQLGLMSLLEPIQNLIFYGDQDPKLGQQLDLAIKPLRRLFRRRTTEWKRKHALARSQFISLWTPELLAWGDL